MLILGAVLALAQGATATPPPRTPAVRPKETFAGQCLAVAVSSPETPRSRVSFSATKVLDLHLGAFLRSRIGGEHVLNLKVYTPKGHLYQQLDVPFRGSSLAAGGSSATAATVSEAGPRLRRVEGYPQPVAEQDLVAARAPAGQRAYRISARLPVAGTSIMAGSLYGRWKIVPYIDDSLKACGAATSFAITQ